MTDAPPLLEAERLTLSFPARRELADIIGRRPRQRLVALDDVSIALGPNETLGVVGESGSGKSTLAKAIVRLFPPDSGSVRFRGQDLLRLKGEQLDDARRRVQLIYQDPYSSLNPRLAVGHAISEPARVHGFVDRAGAPALAAQIMEQVGLASGLAERRPRAFSGGQRQRIAIARALAARPDVLIADEAVSALDVSIQAQILNLFTELQDELGLAMIFISHQLSVVAHIADRVAVMYLGRVVEEGTKSEVFSTPAHPYTVGLLEAQPSRHRRGPRQRPALKGEIPSPLDIPKGCRFRTRCPLAQAICAEIDPPPVRLSDTHSSRCHVLPARLKGEPVPAVTS
jgi:oligopeptide/dipeptide ABC transporter ATP-binding protein